MRTLVILVAALAVAALACTAPAPATPYPTYTPYPTPTVVPSATPWPTHTPYPTYTPWPPPTPEPTVTPMPTVTPEPTPAYMLYPKVSPSFDLLRSVTIPVSYDELKGRSAEYGGELVYFQARVSVVVAGPRYHEYELWADVTRDAGGWHDGVIFHYFGEPPLFHSVVDVIGEVQEPHIVVTPVARRRVVTPVLRVVGIQPAYAEPPGTAPRPRRP